MSQSPQKSVAALRPVAQVISFVLEVAMLAAAFFASIRAISGVGGWILGIVIVVVLVVFWAMFMAPKAKRRLAWPVHPAIAFLLFALSGLALALTGLWIPGVLIIIVAILYVGLIWYLRRIGSPA